MKGPRTIVHVVPTHVYLNKVHGSYKDVAGRAELLTELFDRYEQVLVSHDDPEQLRLPNDVVPTHILVEYTQTARIIQVLRRRWPMAILACRPHNAEPLQHLDNIGLRPLRRIPRLLYGMARLATLDRICARTCDVVLPISEHEADGYWRLQARRNTVAWLPYIPLCSTQGAGPRARVIACLPSPQEHRRTVDTVRQFAEFAAALEAIGAKYECVVTGDLRHWRTSIPGNLRMVGHVDDLDAFLSGIAAVAMLSRLGHGFKTTIGDAVACGAAALLHPRQYLRCPSLFRSGAVSVGGLTKSHLESVLASIATPPVPNLKNLARDLAKSVLEEHFLDRRKRVGA